jgi:hypothetical protein
MDLKSIEFNQFLSYVQKADVLFIYEASEDKETCMGVYTSYTLKDNCLEVDTDYQEGVTLVPHNSFDNSGQYWITKDMSEIVTSFKGPRGGQLHIEFLTSIPVKSHLEDIELLVACHKAETNQPVMATVILQEMTQEELNNGLHKTVAKELCKDHGYSGPFVCFDSNDLPSSVFESLVEEWNES